MSDGAALASFVGGVLAFVALMMVVIGLISYQVDKSRCYSFGRQSNREVKFVRYNLVTWDCLTPTANGKWISTSMLRDLDG